jgi:hypothetical protein
VRDKVLVGGVLVASVVAGACRRAPEPDNVASSAPPQTQASAPPSSAAAAEPAPSTAPPAPAAQAVWTDPAVWTRAPSTSSMRLATYRVPKADGDPEDGEVSVFRFAPGKGGDVKANLERWEKQFTDVAKPNIRQNEKTIAGFAVHLLEIDRGTFASGMPGGPSKPNPGYGLLGAIVETPAGNYFFKLTGPEKTVKAAQRAFYGLLESIKVETAK